MKKIVFFSNYLNHHQMPLADAFYELLGDDYAFVATMPVEAEHLKGGITHPEITASQPARIASRRPMPCGWPGRQKCACLALTRWNMPWSGSSSQNVVSPLSLAKDGSSGDGLMYSRPTCAAGG